jgi:DNA-directed RNA polymerase
MTLPVIQARHKLASYMRDWIIEARVEVVSEAVRIMDYLRDCAKVLAENGYPLSWTTPDECKVTQKYVVLKEKHVRTFDNWMRRLRKRTDQLSPSKNAGAAAPNVVHSLDAAMCRMVALELVDRGIEDMAFVHDSYAVHAKHLDELNLIIRQVAVDIFAGNWLDDTMHQGLLEMIPNNLNLPSPPKQGNLNVREELPRARYFFS